VERKSRLLLLTRLQRKTAELTTDAVILRLQELPEKVRRTLTLDNGTENAQHEAITEAIGIQCYFARPYASWQRGTNKNIDRWKLKTNFNKAVTESKIKHCRFHDLRHTFATRMVQAGVDLYKVSKLMGHKDISTTQRYAHHYPESLRSGVDALDCYNFAANVESAEECLQNNAA
jgi:hypothetical protein